MRSLVLLALVTFATLPLAAHDPWGAPRPRVVFEAPRCAPYRHREAQCRDERRDERWDERRDERWDERWHHPTRAWRYDCDDERSHLRPLAPPFRGRLMVRFR